jgi:hypothetical protein
MRVYVLPVLLENGIAQLSCCFNMVSTVQDEPSNNNDDEIVEMNSDGTFDISAAPVAELKQQQQQQQQQRQQVQQPKAKKEQPSPAKVNNPSPPAPPAPPAEKLTLRQRFEKLVDGIVAELPESEDPAMDTRAQIRASLEKGWDEPRVDEMEFCLQKRFTEDECRTIMFFPDHDQIAHYSKLLCSPPDGAPDTHPQAKLQVRYLVLVYLNHVKSWTLMKDFILSDGLITLVDLFKHENLYLRSQAMDIFMAITAPENKAGFDWFAPPKDPLDAKLHSSMLTLTQHPNFIKSLLENYTDTFPGGSFYALQILAFFMSWVRILYCKDQKLQLSRAILDKLKAWSEREGDVAEEQDMAKKVYEDFSRLPPADGDSLQVNLEKKAVAEAQAAHEKRAQTGEEQHKAAWEAHKAKGNAAFKVGDWRAAIACYTDALKEMLPVELSSKVCAPVYGNRAFAHLKKQQECKDPKGKAAMESLQLCLKDSEAAIDADPTWLKGWYRKSQALSALGKLDGAIEAATEAQKLTTDGSIDEWLLSLQKQRAPEEEEEVAVEVPKQKYEGPERKFEASEAFAGARNGFVFKLGDRGVGYYPDDGDLYTNSLNSYYHFDSNGKRNVTKWDKYDADEECRKLDAGASKAGAKSKKAKRAALKKEKEAAKVQAAKLQHPSWGAKQASVVPSAENAVLSALLKRTENEQKQKQEKQKAKEAKAVKPGFLDRSNEKDGDEFSPNPGSRSSESQQILREAARMEAAKDYNEEEEEAKVAAAAAEAAGAGAGAKSEKEGAAKEQQVDPFYPRKKPGQEKSVRVSIAEGDSDADSDSDVDSEDERRRAEEDEIEVAGEDSDDDEAVERAMRKRERVEARAAKKAAKALAKQSTTSSKKPKSAEAAAAATVDLEAVVNAEKQLTKKGDAALKKVKKASKKSKKGSDAVASDTKKQMAKLKRLSKVNSSFLDEF